jgi:hypothetical protein
MSNIGNDTFRRLLASGVDAADDVVGNWESGDLAGAVHVLEGWADKARPALAVEDTAGPRKLHGDPFAHIVREICNASWSEPAVSAKEAGYLARNRYLDTFKREEGPRVLVRCPLPVGFNSGEALFDLEAELIAHFGGFTVTKGEGGWQSEGGDRLVEAVRVYSVSVPGGDETLRAIAAFTLAGERLGQEWTHITTSEEYAQHRKTGGEA